MSKNQVITTPSHLRGLLVSSAVAVLESRITVAQANCVIGLSSEVHKSIRQEWDMRTEYALDIEIKNGAVSHLLEDKNE